MKSATAISYELDDTAAAARELTEQIRAKLSLCQHTVALLHGQPDMEISELAQALHRELGCSVLGATTAGGAVLDNDGHHELAVILHVMTDDHVLFSTAISDSMREDTPAQIRSTYRAALAGLREQDAQAQPKLVICPTTMQLSCSSDQMLAELADECNGIPIFGFLAADDFEFAKQQVFLDDACGGDRTAILLLAGDVRPIFQTENLAGRKVLDKKQVTRSKDNIIYEIDSKPAYEYIKEFGFVDAHSRVLWNYQFFVEMRNASDDDGVSVSRALNTFNKDTGEVVSFADIPQDSYIGLLYCDGNDVTESSESALTKLVGKLATPPADYRYSTVLVASCSLRNLFLADQKDAEGNLTREMLPKDLTVSGLYAFGEIAPTSVRDGKAVNRFHNATLTICVF